ncbi:branched-chain amino acid ABC transporter substrate-binding protein [Alsobacter soli]|uniref:Branched-chain amino acid ABC transporter substrate-binding protein n=1 Tax=Alsobacter soli TaxID=2109933 RepID=A0A2T1HMP3_9HYPH|nr:ABC transporter substrate-binding protein [Alsobacter soli]PSC02907.1 branched-chain amino acid ABC transporter substrate-binding protein [Alsobacter soli]
MTTGLTRRSVLAGGSALGALAAAGAGPAFAQGGAPIRLGYVAPLSGAQEVLGAPMLLGAKIAVAQINKAGGVNGRMLEIVARDDKASGAEAVTQARDLFGQDVKLLFGAIQTASAMGMMPLLGEANATLISCAAISDGLTHESYVPNYFRISDNSYMRYRALARVMAERYPNVTTWAGVFPDAAYGFSAWDAFKDGLKTYYPSLAKKDVKILEPVLTKFGATDFKQQLTTLMQTPAEGLYNNTNGADAVTLLAQGASFGLSRKFKAVADGANEFNVPKALGKRMIPNFWTAMHWYFGGYADQPMGKQLYDDYVAATGDKFPLGYVEQGHAAVYAYANAIRKAGSTDAKAVVAAMEGMSFDTAKGKRTFRKEDHQAILDINFIEINPKDNELGWEVSNFVRVPGADVIEPPTPGQAVKFQNL